MEQELIRVRGLGAGNGVTQFQVRALEKNIGFEGPMTRPDSQEGRPLLGGGVGRGLFGGAAGVRLPDVYGKPTRYSEPWKPTDASRAESREKAWHKSGSVFSGDPGYPWYQSKTISSGSSGEAFGHDKRKAQGRTTTEFTDRDLELLSEPPDRRAGTMYRMQFAPDIGDIMKKLPRAQAKGIVRDQVTEMRDLCIQGKQPVDGVLAMGSKDPSFPVVWQK